MECIDGRTTGVEDGVSVGKQKWILFPHNWKDMAPAYTSITAPTIVRNGLPMMMGTWEISSMSMIIKSHGMTNLPIRTATSSIIPTGRLLEWYASWMIMVVDVRSSNFSLL